MSRTTILARNVAEGQKITSYTDEHGKRRDVQADKRGPYLPENNRALPCGCRSIDYHRRDGNGGRLVINGCSKVEVA